MAKKTAAKKKPAPRTKAAPVRAAKKSARSKSAPRPAKRRKAAPPARKPVKKAAVKAAVARKKVKVAPKAKTVARVAAKKAPARKASAKAVARKAPAKRAPAKKAAPRKVAPTKVAPKSSAVKKGAARKAAPPAPARKIPAARPAPALDRERRTVGEAEPASTPSSFVSNRHASAASSGADELRVRLASYTGTGPAITAGDVDANWEAAETVGDEAPGGDNPTPDQDVVDEIGKALGVEYDDDEELQGGDEIAARDTDRWELDPASSDDFDER